MKTTSAFIDRLLRRDRVKHEDIEFAWSVLENLTVSLDQIGSFVGDDPARRDLLADLLSRYLDPGLVAQIADARARLSHYISDTESISADIPYWDYDAGATRSGIEAS